MLRSIFAMFAFVAFLTAGCNQPVSQPAPEPPPKEGKVKVVAPGVNVDIQKDAGVKVDVEKK